MDFRNLIAKCSYNAGNKESFRKASTKLLRKVARLMGLAKGSYEVRFNPGGIAVSGDATLHGENIYISFNADGLGPGILVRTCRGRQDYCGGTNRWFSFDNLADEGPDGLARYASEVAGLA